MGAGCLLRFAQLLVRLVLTLAYGFALFFCFLGWYAIIFERSVDLILITVCASIILLTFHILKCYTEYLSRPAARNGTGAPPAAAAIPNAKDSVQPAATAPAAVQANGPVADRDPEARFAPYMYSVFY